MEPETPLAATSDDQARQTYLRNYETLHSILNGGRHASSAGHTSGELSVRLERIVVDHETGELVPFVGERGLEELLARMALSWRTLAPRHSDGRLMGLTGILPEPQDRVQQYGEPLPVSFELGPSGQLACRVGPSPSVVRLLQALQTCDRHIHVAARSLGCDYDLLCEGYNPLVSSPLDVPLVPRTRWTLLNAFLGQTGRYSRDVMRCACSTQIALEYRGERETMEAFRLATALSPLFMFLTDNVRSFRGSGARRCPRMARSLMWEEVDPARCGVIPGTFDRSMSFDRYIEWLMGIQPIFFEDSFGPVSSTGKRTIREIMEERVLSSSEALALFNSAMPNVRLSKDLELLQADALRPTMAAGYAAFVKGILCNPLAINEAWSLLHVEQEQDVELAAHNLRMRGWDATIYGANTGSLVDALLGIARSSLTDDRELLILDNVAEQWEVRMVPRDAFVAQELKAERGW